MNYILTFLISAASLFVAMLVLLELGRRIGVRRRLSDPEGAERGTTAVEGAVFGLMGLLIAFTFSGAAARFDERHHMVVQEANAIGTAYLRINLLPPQFQPALRQKFRDYVDARLAFYRTLPDFRAKQELDRGSVLQLEIWQEAIEGSQAATSPAVMTLMLPALNDMIDITATRTVALDTHPPVIIYIMLGALVLACSLLAGYDMAGGTIRSWLHMLGFALTMTIAVYVILDLEYPRMGLIRVDAVDQVMVQLRNSMR